MNEIEQVNAIKNLPPDLAILRMENENIQALAAAHPRDHKKIRDELVAQIDAYPSFVRTAIYSKPVGRDGQNGPMKFARGLSIRAAEAIAEAYGFCRIRADVTPLDDTTVKVEATFCDYQKGRIWQDGGVLSKFYKSRDGRMTRIPDDRFYNVVVKAEVSKRVREVILRSVPPGLRSELAEIVEQRIENLLDDSTIAQIIAKFSGKGIPQEALEAQVGRTLKAGWTKEDRKDLLGLWNSLEQEETTVAEILGQEPPNGKKPQPKVEGPVSAGDFKPAKAADEPAGDEQPDPQDAVPIAQTAEKPPEAPATVFKGWRCKEPDCGKQFDQPRLVAGKGKNTGKCICPECLSENIEEVK